VVYPYKQPCDVEGLRKLFGALKKLEGDSRFARPNTVVNNQTRYRSSAERNRDSKLVAAFDVAMNEVVQPVSSVTETWAVDSCALWLRGLGDAFLGAEQEQGIHDVFWLIPGDFDYATKEGEGALEKLSEIPLVVLDGRAEICLGEISVPLNSSKQLIDTYGTYGLLYNWFPSEAQGIREVTSKPRSEFFALNYPTLEQALIDSRWYAYEQTLMILLQNMKGRTPVRRISRIELGYISDEESTRSTLSAAMQQVERTERALKLFWREKAESEARPNWKDDFRRLDAQSESVRTSAMVILRRLLN